MRGDIYELRRPKGTVGHEQQGSRYAIVVQNDDVMLSTVVVCPTSVSAAPSTLRPEIAVLGKDTKVLVDQVSTVAPERLGKLVGILPLVDLQAVDRALKTLMGLR